MELGDIERTLGRYPQVASCVVLQHKQEHSQALAAYVIPTEGGTEVQLSGITDWAKEDLPYYMVPNSIQSVRGFPLSSSGKVDRNALVRDLQNAPKTEVPEARLAPQMESQNDWLQSHLQELLNVSRRSQ